MPRITFEQIFDDGGYAATVESYYGLTFAVSYVADEIRPHGLSIGSGTPFKRVKIAADGARKLVAKRLADLGPEFRAKHLALYAEEIAAKAQ